MSEFNESFIRLNLRIISQLKQCDRISSTQEYLHIEKKHMLLPVFRFIRGESRLKNISRIETIFMNAKKIIQEKIQLHDYEKANMLLNEVLEAKRGMTRLKTSTYERDQLCVGKIDLLISNVNSYYSKYMDQLEKMMYSKKQKKYN